MSPHGAIGWRQPTGTFCKKGHPQFIEVRAAKAERRYDAD
jgi:hypothetical protein